MYIPIILGTARAGRQSEKAAKFMLAEVEKFGLKTELIDARDYRLSATDNSEESNLAKKLAEKITRANALIIVSPEYNHGYPGELKMMLDMLYDQYARKPVGICGVSSGGLGGARMVEQLRLVAIELGMAPISKAVYFSSIKKLFDDTGAITDESYYKKTEKFLNELVWCAKALAAKI